MFPVWGDINNDAIVDVLMATRAALGMITFTEGQLARCNVADLYLIQTKALGINNY